MEYPRKVKLISPKLMKLVTEKGLIVEKGRKISEQVEKDEAELLEIDKEIQAAEKTADLADLNEQAQVITDRFNAVVQEMETLKKRMYERVKEKVPAELPAKYEAKKKAKEDREEERNKLALEITKYNDKIIPLARKLMAKELTNEYEDFETLKIEDGVLVGSIFSHLEDFKKNFIKNKK